MAVQPEPAPESVPTPFVFFVGDFNAGKSTVINALLRDETLRCDRRESHALPTFIARGESATAQFSALPPDYKTPHRKSLSQFQGLRDDDTNTDNYRALHALTPANPFARLVLVDTAGMSGDMGSAPAPEFQDTRDAMMVVVTDIEYWSSKHNLDLIAEYAEAFGDSLIVIANKADHLNVNDIKQIVNKAPQRMEDYGITQPPRFFAVSARLELLRHEETDEYRRRTKPTVRQWCDGAFDAFRVALYEFEATALTAPPMPELDLLKTPLAQSVVSRGGVELHEV